MTLQLELAEEYGMISVSDGKSQETISIRDIPSQESLLVKEAVSRLYGRINPVTLYNNLSICADLFGITYDAVAGIKGVQSSVWNLREKMNLTAIDSSACVLECVNRCQTIPMYYTKAIQILLTQPILPDRALKIFSRISQEAGHISAKAKELIERFQQLQDEASTIVQKMLEAKALGIEQERNLEDNINQLNAQISSLKTIQADLESEIEELTEQYDSLNKKIDRASKQQFALSMASVIAGAVGTGLQAYTSTTTAGMINNAGKSVSGAISSNTQNSSMENAQKNLEDTNAKISDIDEKIKELEQSLSEKNQELDQETDDEKHKTLLSEKEALTKQLEQRKAEKNSLQAQATSYKDVIQGLSAGLSSLSTGLSEESSKMSDQVTSLTNMADSVLKQKAAVRKEKREILAKIAENTKIVQNSVVSKNSLDLAIAAISAGIGALNFIVSVLNDFYTFWLSIKVQTANMAQGEIESYITLFGDDPEELQSIDFYSVLANNASQWVALYIVLSEYHDAFASVNQKLQKQLMMKEEADPALMWKRAIDHSNQIYPLIRIQEESL